MIEGEAKVDPFGGGRPRHLFFKEVERVDFLLGKK
jgi:hypothetical protein